MNYLEFIDELKKYLETKYSVSMKKIDDFNNDTLFWDSCDNYYGHYTDCKDCGEDSVFVLMYYEEDECYEVPIFATVNKKNTDIGYFHYLSAENKKDFSLNDLEAAKKIIDNVLSSGDLTF